MFDIQFYMKIYETKQKMLSGDLRISKDDFYNLLEEYRSDEPFIYNIETTNACNMKCEMCPRTTMMTRSIETISLDLFEKIANQLRPYTSEEWNAWVDFVKENYGVSPDEMSENNFFLYVIPRVVVLHGYGDPLLDISMPANVRLLTQKGIPSYFSCNPANINLEKTFEICSEGLAYIKFSVESVSDEEHKKIRGEESDFSTSFAKIKELYEMNQKNNNKTKIVITMLDLGKENQVEEFEKLKEAFADMDVYIYLKSQDQRWYQGKEKDTRSIHWLEFCQFPWSSMTIKSNGEAVECVEDFDNEIVLGNAKRETLKDIWNGKSYNEFRRNHLYMTCKNKCLNQCDMSLAGEYTL